MTTTKKAPSIPLAPLMVRAALIDGQGRPMRTLWSRLAGDTDWPMVGALETGSPPKVRFDRIDDRRLAALVHEASTLTTGGLALDLWLPEGAADVLARGFTVQHWLLPWMVIDASAAPTSPSATYVHDPSPALALGIAIEHPARATFHDLFWPEGYPPPIRAWQFMREQGVPRVATY